MKFELTLTRKVAIGFSLALAIAAGLGIFSYLNTREFVDSAATVTRTWRNLSLLQALLATTVSAESEVRGYVITGNEDFLLRYESAIDEIQTELAQLRGSIRDPISTASVLRLEEFTAARLARLKQTVEARRSGGFEAARVISGPGRQLMEDVRAAAAEIEARQFELLDERERWAGVMTRRTVWTVVASALVAVIVAGASVVILTADVAHRELMERKVLDISERERRRIGQDLHDGICQQLTGISLLSRGLQHRLDGEAAEEAGRVVQLINECIDQTRKVTRGLHPVSDEPSGLQFALMDLARGVASMSKIKCSLDCPDPVPVPDQDAATNLFRIAQEAVQNALRHAQAAAITIGLKADEREIVLSVRDDGRGLPQERIGRGLGLEIMSYRAHSLGARFEITAGKPSGTVVTCTLPRSALT